jgi:hypothetical protein
MILMGYSGARGTLIYEKNLMSKISCQTPFKPFCAVGELKSIPFRTFLWEELAKLRQCLQQNKPLRHPNDLQRIQKSFNYRRCLI